MEPSNSQERVIAGYAAAVAAGWTPDVPTEARCNLCPKPHLPFSPQCGDCAEVLAKTNAARIRWLEQFVETALTVKLYCKSPSGRFGEDHCGVCSECRLTKMCVEEHATRSGRVK